MTKSEIKYILGFPTAVHFDDGVPITLQDGSVVSDSLRVISIEDLYKSKKTIEDYFYWFYPSNDSNVNQEITIRFDENSSKVNSIQCYVADGKFTPIDACAVNGVKALDSEEEVIGHLGKPSSSKISGVTKEISYKNLNMKIFLVKKRVYMIQVAYS